MGEPERPLLVVTGDAAGICDPVTGVCAFPQPDGTADPGALSDQTVSPPA